METFSGSDIDSGPPGLQTVSVCVIQPMIVNTVSSASRVNPI